MKKLVEGFGIVIVLLCFGGAIADAQGLSSNYRTDESFIGPGGTLESNSTNYRTAPGGQSLGNPGGVGDSESTNYRSQAGATTTDDPSLTCAVNTSTLNFGSLSPSVTATATFSVLNYTSHGYLVQIIGNTPESDGHNLTALSSGGTSTIGTMATFIDGVIFRNDVEIQGRLTQNSDAAGFAVIYKTQKKVEVKFDKPYEDTPVVTVNVKNGKFVQYAYDDLTEEGFTIILPEVATEDIEFAWTAVSVKEARTIKVPVQPTSN